MSNIRLSGSAAGFAFSLFAGIMANQAHAESFRDTAAVTEVIQQFRSVNHPHQECWTEQVSAPVAPPHNYGGTILGTIAGGLLGSAVGHGGGRDAAIGIGAATGAVVGDRVGNEGVSAGYQTQDVQHCRQIDSFVQEPDGYLVKFLYNGRPYQTVMPYDPGKTLNLHVSFSPVVQYGPR